MAGKLVLVAGNHRNFPGGRRFVFLISAAPLSETVKKPIKPYLSFAMGLPAPAQTASGLATGSKVFHMYLVQFLLPLHDNKKQKFPVAYFLAVRKTLTDRFGGVTAFLRSPAVGLWKDDDEEVSRDDVVMFEVISAQLDKTWWKDYRMELQQKFRQEDLMFWASRITRL